MKKVFLFLLVLLLLPSALAERHIMSDYGIGAIMLDENYAPLNEAYTYSSITEITPDDTPEAQKLYEAELYELSWTESSGISLDEALQNYNYSLVIDAFGQPINDKYAAAWKYDTASDTLIFCDSYEGWGIMDRAGNILIEADYSDILLNGEGGFLATAKGKNYEDSVKLYYLDLQSGPTDTGLMTTPYFDGYFSDGMILINTYGEDTENVFVDTHGNVLFGVGNRDCYYMGMQGNYALLYRWADDTSLNSLVDAEGNMPICDTTDDIACIEQLHAFAVISADGVHLLDDCTLEEIVCLPVDGLNLESIKVAMWDDIILSVHDDESTRLYDTSYNLKLSADVGTYMMMGNDVDASFFYAEMNEFPQWFVVSDYETDSAYLLGIDGNVKETDYRNITSLMWKDGEARYLYMKAETYMEDGYEAIDWNTTRYGICDAEGNEIVPESASPLYYIGGGICVRTTSKWFEAIDFDGNVLYKKSLFDQLMD